MCVADSYDAMSFRRPYRQGLTDEECLEELERCSGVQFDPEMVAAFRRVLERIAEGRRFAAGVAGRAAAALTADECLAVREQLDEQAPGLRLDDGQAPRGARRRRACALLSPCTRRRAGARSCWPTRTRARRTRRASVTRS